jgi:hypothetical protein
METVVQAEGGFDAQRCGHVASDALETPFLGGVDSMADPVGE